MNAVLHAPVPTAPVPTAPVPTAPVPTAPAPAEQYNHLPVRDAQVGDLYRYVPEQGSPRTGTIVSIAPAGRYDRTQVVFGVDGVQKNSHGKNRTHFIRHELAGTFLGQYKITEPEE